MTEKLAWSCDERDRKECRNAHGCHCQEITHLLARKSAPHGISSLPSGESDLQVTADCGGADTPKQPAELRYATQLAVYLWENHWKAAAPAWKPLPDLMGVLTQIDNMIANLNASPKSAKSARQ